MLCAFLALSGTCAVLWQRNGLSQLHAQAGEPGSFGPTEDTRIGDTTLQQEISALREQAKELPKLRNEASQRRPVRSELAVVRAENARLLEAKQTGGKIPRESPAGFVSRDSLVFVGRATPEAALQSFFWALREGNMRAAMQSMPADNDELVQLEQMPPQERTKIEEQFKASGEVQMMQRFDDFAVASREEISDDEVVLYVRSSVATNTFPHALKRFGSEWKITGMGAGQMSRRKNRP